MLEDKICYFMSHQGITSNPEKKGHADLYSSYGLNSGHQLSEVCLKSRVPLLRQGYIKWIEIDGQRRPLYWSKLLFMCIEYGIDIDLAHVEGVNSSRVYVARDDKADCLELVRQYHSKNPDDLTGLIDLIAHDRRFYFDFVPKETIIGESLRWPNPIHAVDGADLHYLISPPISQLEKDAAAFIAQLDAEEKAFEDEKRRSLMRYGVGSGGAV